jgi:hypothetical protein
MTNDLLTTPTTARTVAIRSLGDIADALVASTEQDGLILAEADLCPEFFDLRTGFAGEVLQKFVNYRARLAIIVPHAKAHGERFSELVYEHRDHAVVRFVSSEEDARRWLKK